jgi:hypothetical protein
MDFGHHPRWKEQLPLAEDLREKLQLTTFHYWLKKISRLSRPSRPNAKVECLIVDRVPRSSSSGLFLGGGKQLTGQLYRPHRALKQLKAGHRIGFYGGQEHGTRVHELLDVAEFWVPVKGEISAWVLKNKDLKADGQSGDVNNLVGM